jgi:DNA-directed RNA polymerase specialized sigma24 family protein
MRHVDGLSLLESAEALDVPLETAKKRYQRALHRFRQLMQTDITP